MESSGAGALAAQAASLPSHSHTPQHHFTDRLTGMAPNQSTDLTFDDFAFSDPPHPPESLNTPLHIPTINHFQASHVRDSGDLARISSPTSNDAANAANILANGNGMDVFDADLPAFDAGAGNVYEQYMASLDNMVDPFEPDPAQEELLDGSIVDEQRENMRAYAKIVLPDGDFYVTSQKVIVGRDMDCFRRYQRQQRREERQAEQAQHALDQYALEPSQPSQPDDADNPFDRKSNDSLEGRPARALPSNYSEQGGAVSFAAASDDEAETRRFRRKRRLLHSKSSSTASVTPANLHPRMINSLLNPNASAEEIADVEDETTTQILPVHTINPADIRKISKEHLIIEYNSDEEKWELNVCGRIGAFVNNEWHSTGAMVSLSHNDVITVATLNMTFKLPDTSRPSPGLSRTTAFDSEFAEDDLESRLDETPSKISGHPDGIDGDEATGDQRPKVLLKLKRPGAGKEEAPKKVDQPAVAVHDANDQAILTLLGNQDAIAGADNAPKPDPHEQGAPLKLESTPPPTVPTNLEPGSIFEGVAAEELPQKRKGPGRPPKNGLISKRDQSFVKRKLKEYEKRGEVPPPMDTLVAIVRAENKAKEAATKAASRGEAPPEMSIMQSIEADPNVVAQRPDAVPQGDMAHKTSATPVEPVRKSSPNPKRIAKSVSPMKPESEYTEEDLKKPTITYVHILDEVLRNHPEGRADLQEIYDRICKRYPHFKYRTGTAGWQSSVRHNLLQHERFMENGRSGKGRLWAVNYDFPLEKEKKRRPSPPQRPPPMPNGHFGPGQMPPYGHMNYNSQYGPPNVNGQNNYGQGPQAGQGAYYSPYGPPQGRPYGAPPGQPGQPAPNMGPGGPPQQQQYPPPPPQPRPPQQRNTTPAQQFQGIVDEIMSYRTNYLSQFVADSDPFKQHDDIFKKCTNLLSNIFHGTSAEVEANLDTDEERRVFTELKAIFNKYEHLKKSPSAERRESANPTAGSSSGSGPQGEQGQQAQAQPAAQQQGPYNAGHTAAPSVAPPDGGSVGAGGQPGPSFSAGTSVEGGTPGVGQAQSTTPAGLFQPPPPSSTMAADPAPSHANGPQSQAPTPLPTPAPGSVQGPMPAATPHSVQPPMPANTPSAPVYTPVHAPNTAVNAPTLQPPPPSAPIGHTNNIVPPISARSARPTPTVDLTVSPVPARAQPSQPSAVAAAPVAAPAPVQAGGALITATSKTAAVPNAPPAGEASGTKRPADGEVHGEDREVKKSKAE